MKKCLRKKCQKEFEPNKPKQVFCSAKCRVYFSREEKEEQAILVIKDLNKQTNVVEAKKTMGSLKSNYTIKTNMDIEPAEGTNRFFLKYGAFTHEEAKKLK